MKNASKILD